MPWVIAGPSNSEEKHLRFSIQKKHFLFHGLATICSARAVEQPMAARKSLPQKTNGAKNRGDVKVDTAGVMTTRHLSFSRSFPPPCHSSSRCTEPRHWDCCRAIYHGHRNRCESIFLLSKMASSSALPPPWLRLIIESNFSYEYESLGSTEDTLLLLHLNR